MTSKQQGGFIDHRERPEPRVYTGDGWTVINGRWQDSPPEVVDVVCGDPPYNEATHKGHALGFRSRAAVQFDPVDPGSVCPELLRISNRWVVLFCADLQISDYGRAAGGHRVNGGQFVRMGGWYKIGPAPQFSGDRPGTWCECIAIMHPFGSMRWNGKGRPAVWRHPPAHGSERLHETPKPIALLLDLVADFSDPDELVWDPYCGSGTTGVACLRLGRRFLGHEMQPRLLASKRLPDGRTVWLEHPHDQPYARIAAERLRAEGRGLTLQAARAGQLSILDAMEGP
jgi:site-specific DNA-methyltransferase (adenine-specific)